MGFEQKYKIASTGSSRFDQNQTCGQTGSSTLYYTVTVIPCLFLPSYLITVADDMSGLADSELGRYNSVVPQRNRRCEYSDFRVSFAPVLCPEREHSCPIASSILSPASLQVLLRHLPYQKQHRPIQAHARSNQEHAPSHQPLPR